MSCSLPLRGNTEYEIQGEGMATAFVGIGDGADMFSLPLEGAEMGRS